MQSSTENIERRPVGYSLIEMLIVAALIMIIATIPVALLRRSREKVHEAEALKSLRMMALAYENYYAQNGHRYPNYRSDGAILDDIWYADAEQIWDMLISERLIPSLYSGKPHDREDLLGKGYSFSIVPSDSGGAAHGGVRNSYAFAMVPYEGSPAKRGLLMIQGQKFYSFYPTPLPRKTNIMRLYSLDVYSMPD